MIIVRSMVTFRADFSDDCVADDFDIVLFGGKNVTEAIRDILVAQGCTDAKVRYDREHGWDLNFAYQGYPLWVQVVQMDPEYLLTCKESPTTDDGSDSVSHLEVLLLLNDQLRGDGRFHDLVWYRYRDYLGNRPGSDTPVSKIDQRQASGESKQGLLKTFLSVFRGPF